MTTHSPPRRLGALLAVLTVAAATFTVSSSAAADDGAAPAPKDYRVISGVHADAISTFLDQGRLTLGSKADVEGAPGKRFAAEDVWFRLENAAQVTVPAGYEFIGPTGSAAWIAPESNPGIGRLWPGFNTESIPAGSVDGDKTTFTLTSFEGPGAFELYAGGAGETVNRLWSSQDRSLRTFDVGRTHMHANWAFTATGTYKIGVESTATVDGAVQSAPATFTFVVGDIATPVTTTTVLSASATDLVAGESLTLAAEVSPSHVDGFIEFRNGSSVLGHEALLDGSAALEIVAPAVGTHALTATYVPAVANLASASTSAPVSLTVTDGSGVPFGISGIAPTYAPGETLNARVVGHTPADGETYRWVWRQVGTDYAYVLRGGGQEAQGKLTLPVDMSHDNYEVSVQVRQGNKSVTQSSWVPITVRSDVQPLDVAFPEGDMYLGDEIFLTLDGDRQEGDSIRIAQRGNAGPWFAFTEFEQIDAHTLQFKPTWQSSGAFWTIQTVRDGVVVAQSEPVAKDVRLREVHVEGLQGVYRVGQTLRATARVYPEIEGLTYTWSLQRSLPDAPYFESQVLKQGTAASDLSLELPIEKVHQGWSLAFEPSLLEGHPSGATQVGSFTQVLNVSDSSPDTQLLFFQALSEHYHQGYDVNLKLVADPALADGDTIAWQWRWPNTDEWVQLPGAEGMEHALIAEQALDGVEVRATLKFASGDDELVGEPVTVRVDDHGSPPRQKVTVTGAEVRDGVLTATEGDQLSVSAHVEHGTVLTSYQWFLKSPGATEAKPIHDVTSAAYDLDLTTKHDGAELSVAVVKSDGTLAYGPSAPVLVSVTERTGPAVTITGAEESYEVGDTMALRAEQDPESGEGQWQWLIKRAGSEDYAVLDTQGASTLNREVSADDNGAKIIVRLYDSSDVMLAESSPVSVTVATPGAPARPAHAPVAQSASTLGDTPAGGISLGKATVSPGERLTIDLGAEHGQAWVAAWLFSTPTLLSGDWLQATSAGEITVHIPAEAELGKHRLAVFDASGSLIGWADLEVVHAANGQATTGDLAATGSAVPLAILAIAGFLVFAGTLLMNRPRKHRAAP